MGLVLLIGVGVFAYHIGLGAGVPGRAQQLRQMQSMTLTLGFLFGDPVPLTTVGGFLTTIILAHLPVILGAWAVVSASGLIRGEEEAGILDVHLAAPVGRGRLAAGKFAAYTLVCAGLGSALGAALIGWGAALHEPIGAGPALLAALNVVTLAWFWGALAGLLGQVAGRRAAAGMAGGAMALAHLVVTNLSGRPWYGTVARLIPHHYFALNKPLAPGRAFAWDAYGVLLAGGLLLLALAAGLFTRRDLRAGVRVGRGQRAAGRGVRGTKQPAIQGRAPAHNTSTTQDSTLQTQPSSRPTAYGLRPTIGWAPFARALRDLAGPTVAWGVGICAYTLLMLANANAIFDPVRSLLSGPLGQLAGTVSTMMHLLEGAVLHPVKLLLTGFALTQVSAWAAEEEGRRLEVVLSTPWRRETLLATRFAAVILAASILAAAFGITLWLGGRLFGVAVDADLLGPAILGLPPLVGVMTTGGWALSAMLPRPSLAGPIAGALLVAMYFLELLWPFLHPPFWLLQCSVFYQYGRPFAERLGAYDFDTLVLETLLLLTLAIVHFRRRDLAT